MSPILYPGSEQQKRAEARIAAQAQLASSAEASSEQQAHGARCALAAGSLPVSAAEALLAQWDHLANFHAASRRAKDHYGRGYAAGLADAYTIAAAQLRQQMAATNERQPEENLKDEPRRP